MATQIDYYLGQIKLPDPQSHKGQNGKLLIIGGSELFHAASKWSLDIASKFVDMVFYSSVPSNNELIQQAKGEFWNGIVVARAELENYLEEADCVLIGPGMVRSKLVGQDWTDKLLEHFEWLISERNGIPIAKLYKHQEADKKTLQLLKSELNIEDDTYGLTNYLLAKYPHKKWVIDAGALQMIEPYLLNEHHIITPHYQELQTVFRHLAERIQAWEKQTDFKGDTQVGQMTFVGGYAPWNAIDTTHLPGSDRKFDHYLLGTVIPDLSLELNGATVLLKGKDDRITNGESSLQVAGGNAGMTKGGTGDVLAGLAAALYCHHDALTAAVVASFINKKAGDSLYERVGPYFNASDLVAAIPEVFWTELQRVGVAV